MLDAVIAVVVAAMLAGAIVLIMMSMRCVFARGCMPMERAEADRHARERPQRHERE